MRRARCSACACVLGTHLPYEEPGLPPSSGEEEAVTTLVPRLPPAVLPGRRSPPPLAELPGRRKPMLGRCCCCGWAAPAAVPLSRRLALPLLLEGRARDVPGRGSDAIVRSSSSVPAGPCLVVVEGRYALWSGGSCVLQ